MKAALPIARTRSAWALPAVFLLAMSAACTPSDGSDDGGSASSCAYRVEYERHAYLGAEAKGFTIGERVGVALLPPCDDTPGNDSAGDDGPTTSTSKAAYAIKGVDPGVAIALEESADDVIFVNIDSDKKLPEIKELIQGP